MIVGIAKAAKGVITLPDELRDALGDAENILVVKQNDGLYLKRIEPPREGGLLEIVEKLSALNEVDPITAEQLEAEIEAARATHSVDHASAAPRTYLQVF